MFYFCSTCTCNTCTCNSGVPKCLCMHLYPLQQVFSPCVSCSLPTGSLQPEPLQCLAIQGKIVFASYGGTIKAFKRGKEANCYRGHEGEVHTLLPFGEHLVSIDDCNQLKIWHIRNGGKDDCMCSVAYMHSFLYHICMHSHAHTHIQTHTHSLSLYHTHTHSLSITHTHTC